jgi:hypothetical protein
MASRTVRDYTRISYDAIVEDLLRIATSPDIVGLEDEATGVKLSELQDWLKSSTGRQLAEWLAHVGEVDAFHIIRAFQNSFVTTANTKFGAITSSRSMGYSIRRPTPASCSYMPSVSGTVSAVEGYFSIPQGYSFNIGGRRFISKGTTTWYWRADGVVNYLRDGQTDPPVLYQGEFKKVSFFAAGSTKFQKFYIDDATFSNLYGDKDPFYSSFTSAVKEKGANLTVNDDKRITKITVDGVPWAIDRRSLALSTEGSARVSRGVLTGSTNKVALVRATSSGGIEIKFGDGTLSQIPYGVVEVEYLSTLGSSGIVTNIINSEIQGSGTISYAGDAISDENLTFNATTDAMGGADMESNDSISENAIAGLASRSALVNKNSHINYLNNVSGVRQGVTFGEDDVAPGQFYMFNVIGYSLIKDLYTKQADGSYATTEPYQYALYGAEVEHITERYYSTQINYPGSNLYFGENSYPYINEGSELKEIQTNMSALGQIGMKYAYIPPKVHKFKLAGTIVIGPATKSGTIMASVKNNIYDYLHKSTKFAQPIYDSAMTSIVTSIPGVVGCMLNLSPVSPEVDILGQSVNSGSRAKAFTLLYKSAMALDILMSNSGNDQSFYYWNMYDGAGGTLDESYYTAKLTSLGNLKKTKTTIDKITKKRTHDGVTEKKIDYLIYTVYCDTVGKAINQNVASAPSTQHELSTNPITIDMYAAFVDWAATFRSETNYYTAYNLTSGDSGDSNIDDYSAKNETSQIMIEDINFTFKVQA